MTRALWMALACGCLFAVPVCAQSQQNQTKPPAGQQPAQPQGSNPFPDDTNSVPVLPSTDTPAAAAPAPDTTDYSNVPLASADADPVHSPDDTPLVPDTGGSSSSSAGIDQLLKAPPEPEKTGRHHKGDKDADDAPHQETAKEDETVGGYYLDQKNWKAALSRFQSALVMDPENPDVYWGLAEAQRHLGDYAAAKGNYLKVMEYDPDSKHSKDSKNLLKAPELANVRAAYSTAAAPQTQPQP
jgi:tetratricopeptide (TPR) repeat protein